MSSAGMNVEYVRPSMKELRTPQSTRRVDYASPYLRPGTSPYNRLNAAYHMISPRVATRYQSDEGWWSHLQCNGCLKVSPVIDLFH